MVGPETWWGKLFVAFVLVLTFAVLIGSCIGDYTANVRPADDNNNLEMPVQYVDTPVGTVMCVGYNVGLSCDWEGMER